MYLLYILILVITFLSFSFWIFSIYCVSKDEFHSGKIKAAWIILISVFPISLFFYYFYFRKKKTTKKGASFGNSL
jgi:type VI protein secretion system component VasK